MEAAVNQKIKGDVHSICIHCGHPLGVLHTETAIQEPPDFVPAVSFRDYYFHIPGIGYPGKGNTCNVVKKAPLPPMDAMKNVDAYIKWACSLNLAEYYCMCKEPEPDLR